MSDENEVSEIDEIDGEYSNQSTFCTSLDENVKENEKIFADAAVHVHAARKMREMVNRISQDSKLDALENVPKSSCRYCLVGDFCQI
jgi:hypothetical protein